ncbi:methylated-DNA--[protein]-cysteine S-methyltransferase [Glycocaulis sp.]|uniref:methylated-DNA--[protein]-cysteine S-methyltransferase n=1 Tax=Glycocaulis sp. TaxID=1969725 RepID=UPI0025C1DCBA|nr:methylated-DNA--[protein]-cysteine S-methyltransferase [Glycocaulis sp.]MCH8522570.1 methylated-DNA--[protein]-cysteine S-methyltransferase [Glycocaulis sp.]
MERRSQKETQEARRAIEALIDGKEGAPLAARWLETPLGPMLAVADRTGLHALGFPDGKGLAREIAALKTRTGSLALGPSPILDQAEAELDAYFAGRSLEFRTPVVQHGSAFQQAVWTALMAIPAGQTTAYGELARAMNQPGATRAVAAANGRNAVAIMVPCHRVIGADGSLTGYGGRLWRKTWLLEHEARVTGQARQGEMAL